MAEQLERPTVDRLLTAVEETIAKVKYCWAVTTEEDGQANARPMGPIPSAPGDDAWTFWFLTNRDSRKVTGIRRAARVTLVFQHDDDDSYVTLIGRGEIVTNRETIHSRWNTAWNRMYPDGSADENAVFVRTEAERLELWIRGVTLNPFGVKTTVLKRDSAGQWRLAS